MNVMLSDNTHIVYRSGSVSILIKNCTIVTMNEERDVIHEGALIIKDSQIDYVGSLSGLPEILPEPVEVIDASNTVVFPGLINAHTHSYQALIKGLACDKTLDEWLRAAALPAAAALTAESALAGSTITAYENAHSGVTTVVDMFPRLEPEIYAAVIEGYEHVGIDPVFAAGYMFPKDGLTIDKLASQLESLLRAAQNMGREIMLAPFQVWNNDQDSLAFTRTFSKMHDLQRTIHALETQFDINSTYERYGLSELDTLSHYGLLTERTLLVHGVQCSEEEMIMLAEKHVSMCYSPVCNMYLGSGCAPIPRMLEHGVNICLGTEGAGCNNNNNMLETLKFATLSQKAIEHDPAVLTAQDVLEMATINGAKALGKESSIGSLEVGKDADLFIFDPYADATGTPILDPVASLVYSSTPKNISTVISKGDIVLRGGIIEAFDERIRLMECESISKELVNKAGITTLN